MSIHRNGDKANAVDCNGASVSKEAGAHAEVAPKGKYHAVTTGPVEHLRAEYVALRDRLSRAGLAGWADRALNGRRLLAEFLAIPLEVKWADGINNIVTTVGKNDLLDKYIGGSGYTAACVMGLKGVGTAVVGDTQASHASWNEVGSANAPAYTAPRKTPSFSAAAAGSKATSAAVAFPITSSGTVAGCFINMGGSSTIDNTTGVLFSAGDFTGGNKTVSNGDTLNVTYTLSA